MTWIGIRAKRRQGQGNEEERVKMIWRVGCVAMMFGLVVLTAVQLASRGLIDYTPDSDTDKKGGFTLRR